MLGKDSTLNCVTCVDNLLEFLLFGVGTSITGLGGKGMFDEFDFGLYRLRMAFSASDSTS